MNTSDLNTLLAQLSNAQHCISKLLEQQSPVTGHLSDASIAMRSALEEAQKDGDTELERQLSEVLYATEGFKNRYVAVERGLVNDQLLNLLFSLAAKILDAIKRLISEKKPRTDNLQQELQFIIDRIRELGH